MCEHESGSNKNSYTYDKRPVQLEYCDFTNDVNAAIAWEKQIKGWSRKKKEALIERNWNKLNELSECKNLTSHKYYLKK